MTEGVRRDENAPDHAAGRAWSQAPDPASDGVLELAATPIGTLADASGRLARALRDADVIAAEDTRRLRKLTSALGVEPAGRVVSYFEGNESARTPALVDDLRNGRRVLLVTDAGMPSVSDPGYRLVTAALEAGATVTAIPGPSAVLTALAVSGLPVDRFCFEGFLPRKSSERAARLAELAGERRTMVFFESPHRLASSLEALAEAFGAERPAAVCRELTKLHEQVRRGPLAELASWAADGVKGEITLVVGGAPAEQRTYDTEELARLVSERMAEGASRRDAVAAVVRQTGASRNAVYAASVHASDG